MSMMLAKDRQAPETAPESHPGSFHGEAVFSFLKAYGVLLSKKSDLSFTQL